MREIKAICFDLDDTLWDLMSVISHAENTIYHWFEQNYPRVAQRYSPADLRRLRTEVANAHPEYHHDLMRLRMICYERIATDCGYQKSMSREAFDAFQVARNEVTLFDDVLPALQKLSNGYPLFTLSNGNADLRVIGLDQWFRDSYTAADIGVAKPDPHIYRTVCERTGFAPEQLLHVGDDPHNDIYGPAAIGMPAVWINRGERIWPDDLPEPLHEISDMQQLPELLADS